jgi:cytochrome c-type biogenesis protein CcmH
MTSSLRRWAPWAALAVVLAVALVIGSRPAGGPTTSADRVRHIAAELRCPTCRSQSALESDAEVSRAMRAEIQRRVDAGETDAQIRAYFVSKFGKDILLRPEGRGVSALVWILPVVALVAAIAGLVVAFRRWRPRAVTVSDDDRRLVEDALHGGAT